MVKYLRVTLIVISSFVMFGCTSLPLQFVPEQIIVSNIDESEAKNKFIQTLLRSFDASAYRLAHINTMQSGQLIGVKQFESNGKKTSVFLFEKNEGVFNTTNNYMLTLEFSKDKTINLSATKRTNIDDKAEPIVYHLYFNDLIICSADIRKGPKFIASDTKLEASYNVKTCTNDKDYGRLRWEGRVSDMLFFRSMAGLNEFVSLLMAAYPDMQIKINQ